MRSKQRLANQCPLFPVGVRATGRGPSGRGPSGFSLIDVLVSIAVVMVLIAIMLPSLTAVRETAHRVICRSNVRQIGIGIAIYAQENSWRLPDSIYVEDGDSDDTAQPEEMMTLRIGQEASPDGARWDGLGRLFVEDYLPAPLIFYCPSHRGENSFDAYAQQWASTDGHIRGNYHFRGIGPNGSTRLDHIEVDSPRSALVADGMRSLLDFNHRVGTNVLRADLSVDWFEDSGALAALLQDSSSSEENLDAAWGQLDGLDHSGPP